MIIPKGQTVICDGSFKGPDGETVACAKELHPQTRAILNKAGVTGHFCDFCHDPFRTKQLAQELGYAEADLRMRFSKIDAAQKALDDKNAAAKAAGDAVQKAADAQAGIEAQQQAANTTTESQAANAAAEKALNVPKL